MSFQSAIPLMLYTISSALVLLNRHEWYEMFCKHKFNSKFRCWTDLDYNTKLKTEKYVHVLCVFNSYI